MKTKRKQETPKELLQTHAPMFELNQDKQKLITQAANFHFPLSR